MSELTVLLVLSEPELRRVASAGLARAGFLPLVCEDPESLAAGGRAPSVVLIDGAWPDGEALAACHRLRVGDWSAAVPVLWVGGAEDEAAALAVGASAFVGLPLDVDELVAHVSALAEGGPARTRLEHALGHWRSLDLDEAGQELLAAAGEEPGSVLATWGQYLSGVARFERGQHQIAAEEFQALLDEQPGFWRAHAQLSRLYRHAGFNAEADDHLRQARQLNPSLSEDATFEPIPIPEFALPGSADQDMELVTADEPVPSEEVEDGRPVVLLADDSELALAMIGDRLESAGYRVITAADGLEALEQAKARRPDLVVLDGLMPGKNGFDTCRALKEEVFDGDCPPVVILSAIYTKRKQVREAVDEYGADDLIAKSTDDAALLAAAAKLCPIAGR